MNVTWRERPPSPSGIANSRTARAGARGPERASALALLSKVMPGGGEGDLKYLYGFRPSGDHYDPFAPPADPQKWALPP